MCNIVHSHHRQIYTYAYQYTHIDLVNTVSIRHFQRLCVSNRVFINTVKHGRPTVRYIGSLRRGEICLECLAIEQDRGKSNGHSAWVDGDPAQAYRQPDKLAV